MYKKNNNRTNRHSVLDTESHNRETVTTMRLRICGRTRVAPSVRKFAMTTTAKHNAFTLAEVAEPQQHTRRWSFAFTLAEVLITLAIIGVVAALTIPTLLTNVTDRQFKAGHNTFQRKFGEALRVMNTQGKLGGYKTTEAFVKELSKNIKVLKTCEKGNLTDCFADKITSGEDEIEVPTLTSSKELGRDWESDVMGVQFVNGVSALLAYNPSCKGNPYDNDYIKITGSASSRNDAIVKLEDSNQCIAMIYDVNSNAKPNVVTNDVVTNPKDVGTINVSLSNKPSCKGELVSGTGTTKYCYIGTNYNYIDTCDGTSKYDKDGSEAIIDHECLENYWAGANKACEESGGTLMSESALNSLFDSTLGNLLNDETFFTANNDSTPGYVKVIYDVDYSGSAPKNGKHSVLCQGNW